MRNPDSLKTKPNEDTPQGLAFALAAYVMWGVLPLYLKLISDVPPIEVVAHRIIWSVPIAAFVLIIMRRTSDLRDALRSPKTLAMACVTAALISVNWGVYIWAISSDHALEAALGYYINPLFSIFLAAVLLGERLDKLQLVALALAGGAVVVLTIDAGRLPLAALGLTFSWGFYAFAKKRLPVGPIQGFLLEVLILLIPAAGYLCYLAINGSGHFATGPASTTFLLIGTGAVTAVPLMIYANGAKLLRLSTIGFLQYITPTMVFLIAVFIFNEPMDPARMIAFPMIWVALAIYSLSILRNLGRRAA